MGLGGGLVKKVFSKSRSSPSARGCNERNFGADKSKWSSVRLYLCGDEFNSVLTEDDLASVKSSEATVMQPSADGSGGEESCLKTKEDDVEELITKEFVEEQTSPNKLFVQEKAAIFIQSAFRGLMARRRYEVIKESNKSDSIGMENLSGANGATSTEVVVGDSSEHFSAREENAAVQHRVLQKARSQVYRLKEEWDDSTVSSDISKLRIQYRLEATTRRERALAYAFSQQLRTCTTKKKLAQSNSTTEPSTGWSWLERWMATRAPENSLVEDCWSKHQESTSSERRAPLIAKKRFDVSVEEKESCGSNDVSVSFDGITMPCQTTRDGYGPVKNKLKAARTLSRRTMLPGYHNSARSSKGSKGPLRKAEMEKGCKQVQPKSREETQCTDASQPPSDYQN